MSNASRPLRITHYSSLITRVCMKSALPAEMAKPRVLIVEDESDVRRLYAIGLNQRGFEVKLAANGAEAVERIASEKPDVILLDWLMPLMDGGEVLNKLSGNGNGPVSVIVISGQQPPETVDPRMRRW